MKKETFDLAEQEQKRIKSGQKSDTLYLFH